MKLFGRASAVPITALSLRKNISWTFAGNLVYVLCQWGMLVVFAKLGSPEMVGRFALGLAVTAPIVLFANLSLRQVQATDTRREYVFSDYLGLRLLTTILALSVITGLALVAYPLEMALVILAVGVAKCFEAMSDVFYGLLQQRERMDRIARSMMIKGILSLAALGLIVYLTDSVFWGAAGLAVVWAVILFGYDVRSGMLILGNTPRAAESVAGLRPHWDAGTTVRLLWTALPLGVVAALVSFNVNIPRYLLEQHLGTREVGLFSAIAYVVVAGNIVVDALGQSSAPRLATYYASGNHWEFRRLLLKLALLGALLGGAGVLASLLAGPWVLSLLYTPEYAEYAGVFVWIMVAAGLGYISSLLRFGITAARYFRSQVPLLAGVAGVTVAGCAVFIPATGILGAAIGVVIGMVFQLVGASVILIHAAKPLREKSSKR